MVVWVLMYEDEPGYGGVIDDVFSTPEKAVLALRRSLPHRPWLDSPKSVIPQQESEDRWRLTSNFYVQRHTVDPEYRSPSPGDIGATA